MTDISASAATSPAATERTGDAPITRRALVRNTALAGGGAVAAVLLTGCSDQDAGARKATEPFEVSAAEVPVGAGIVLPAHNAIVTQPVAGEYYAFSAVCTHKGCLVSEVREKGAFCGCHSSYFDISTGEAVSGPAQEPLPKLNVTKQGDNLSIAP